MICVSTVVTYTVGLINFDCTNLPDLQPLSYLLVEVEEQGDVHHRTKVDPKLNARTVTVNRNHECQQWLAGVNLVVDLNRCALS